MKFAMVFLSIFLFTGAAVSAKVKVIDGDSILLNEREIRLSGIDAPEYHQFCYDAANKAYHCGDDSFKALQKMINERLECKTITVDRYKRDVAVCYVDGEDINRKMILSGWAVSYNRYSHEYDDAEKEAQRNKRGIWRGRFMKPELYRALKR